MNYAKPQPRDPRRPANAGEILGDRFTAALDEEASEDPEEDDPAVLGFFR